jgi:hypothetical protein
MKLDLQQLIRNAGFQDKCLTCQNKFQCASGNPVWKDAEAFSLMASYGYATYKIFCDVPIDGAFERMYTLIGSNSKMYRGIIDAVSWHDEYTLVEIRII